MWTLQKIALFPSPVKVCGVRLMPLTVGQLMLLEHFENPYLVGGMTSEAQLVMAVLTCRLPFGLMRWLVGHPVLLGFACGWVRGRMVRGGMRWTEEGRAFRRWIHECTWTPDRFRREGEPPPKPTGVPASYRIMAALLGKFRKAEILAMPMPEANLHALAASANSGAEYETPEEYSMMKLPVAPDGLPEGYAYHEEDYPEIQAFMEAQRRMADRLAAEREQRKKEEAAHVVEN